MPDVSHKDALELIEDDWRADRDNRDEALEDLRFLSGDQWDDSERQARKQAGRPTLTVNQLGKFVNQVTGDIRQAAPAIEAFPVDNADDMTTAQIVEGLIRQIEYQSSAQGVYAFGAENAVRCGIGHWRVETDFTQDSVFEQEIKLKRVIDPLSIIWDAAAIELDRSDANHVFVTEWVHENAFKRRFKSARRTPTDVPVDGASHSNRSEIWRRDNFTRIAEYWYKVPVDRIMAMTQDGKTLDVTEQFVDEEQAQASGQFQAVRKVRGSKIKRRIMDGTDWLGDVEDWAGQFLPIVPVIGREISFDGQIIRSGLIRDAKDPQKLYNYWRSASAEAIAKAPKSPWLVTPGHIENFQQFWDNANRSDQPYLPYNLDENNPQVIPRRQDPPQVPNAFWQEAGIASDDMQATTGIFNASLGAKSNETSGRAILARQREGDVGSFVFSDNFALALARTGRILVDLIPRIYDTARQVRILQRDGSEAFAQINQPVPVADDGEPALANDLSTGRFDVRVKMGASYTTARVEAREQMAQAMQANPQLWSVIGDLFFKNSDYPGAEEIAERLRKTIPPQLLGDDGEEQEQEADPMADMAARLELLEKQAGVQEKQAKAEKAEAEAGGQELENVAMAAQLEAAGIDVDGSEQNLPDESVRGAL